MAKKEDKPSFDDLLARWRASALSGDRLFPELQIDRRQADEIYEVVEAARDPSRDRSAIDPV